MVIRYLLDIILGMMIIQKIFRFYVRTLELEWNSYERHMRILFEKLPPDLHTISKALSFQT